ncbi:MAG: tetratricopeptide repeat protein, partial [Myxococcales bacterium]|nr:tetratricopeptide repeat protein [Myxococcales bacterium]
IPIRRRLAISLYESGREEEAIASLQEIDSQGGATADALFLLGKHFYDAHEYDAAIPYFQRYLVDVPDDAGTHGALGNAYLRTEQYEWAIGEFRTVLMLDPSNLTARINMGDVYFAMSDWAQAIEIYEIVLPNAQDNYRVWFNLGKAQFENGDFNGALESFDAFITLRPELYQGHYFKGAALQELGRAEDARTSLEASAELDSSHAMTRYRLGQVRLALGDFDGARDAFQAAVDLDSNEVWFQVGLGNAHRRLGDAETARSLHQSAVDSEPEEVTFRTALARDLIMLGRLDEAIEQLEEGLALSTDDQDLQYTIAVAQLHRATAAIRESDAETASASLEAAEQTGQLVDHVARARASLLLLEGSPEAALGVLEGPATRDPENPENRRLRARALLELDRAEEVVEAYAGGEPTDPIDRGLLGLAAVRTGDWELASELLEDAIELDEAYESGYAIAMLRQGMDAADHGHWGDAERLFESASEHAGDLSSQDRMRIAFARGFTALQRSDFDAAARLLGDVREDIGRASGARLPSADRLSLNLLLAYANYRRGRYEDTLRLATGDDNADLRRIAASAHERLAMTAYDSGDTDSAERHLGDAIRVTPDDPVLDNNYACLLYARGDYGEAGERFERLAEGGSPVQSQFNYGVYLEERERERDRAIEWYRGFAEQSDDETVGRIIERLEAVYGL